jgi:hypothetical protein
VRHVILPKIDPEPGSLAHSFPVQSWLAQTRNRRRRNACNLIVNGGSFSTPQATTYNGNLSVYVSNPPMEEVIYDVDPAHPPQHGIVVLNTLNGNFGYTPSGSYIGPDSFAFRVIGHCNSKYGTVSITVTPP